MRTLTPDLVSGFRQYLVNEEKAPATIRKYIHDVEAFRIWLPTDRIEKTDVLAYKNHLIRCYAPTSVNAAVSSLNSFFSYCEWFELRMKNLKLQKQLFSAAERELSKGEYERLLRAARDKGDERLWLLMQTICSTGIRVSELGFISAEAVYRGRTDVQCKGKRRTVWLPSDLCGLLKRYMKKQRIQKGPVFVSKNGRPLDRSNIWTDMKKLCRAAGISEKKVFPHNLRHLFARTYYGEQKDVVRLADILGHASVNTTRIYTMESGEVHRRQIERLGLVDEGEERQKHRKRG